MIKEFVPSCAAPNPMSPGPPGREETALHARAAFQLSRAKMWLIFCVANHEPLSRELEVQVCSEVCSSPLHTVEGVGAMS